MAVDATSIVGPSVTSGTFEGTTAAQTIAVGFRPNWLILWNQEDGDNVIFWHNSDLTGVVSVTTATATNASAITVTDHGFSLPASDNVVNENGKTYVFLAGR